MKFLSQFSTCSLWYNALLVIRRCVKLDRSSDPTKIVKSAKHIQKKTKRREQIKNIESMK